MRFLGDNETYFENIRNDLGGHFGEQAARHAVKAVSEDYVGRLEIRTGKSRDKVGVRFGFAGEMVASVMFRHRGELDRREYFQQTLRLALDGFNHSTGATATLANYYLIPRFQ